MCSSASSLIELHHEFYNTDLKYSDNKCLLFPHTHLIPALVGPKSTAIDTSLGEKQNLYFLDLHYSKSFSTLGLRILHCPFWAKYKFIKEFCFRIYNPNVLTNLSFPPCKTAHIFNHFLLESLSLLCFN